ncbi:hypothetical protein [Alteromonas sp. D210916BOD_24]|uniref:hypothetical protein n=1 Tax=Alteromonas sp. D210916BOD_24 TaxID=3157618 RepID=UPI00399D3730
MSEIRALTPSSNQCANVHFTYFFALQPAITGSNREGPDDQRRALGKPERSVGLSLAALC